MLTIYQIHNLLRRQNEVISAVFEGMPIEKALAGTQGILDGTYPSPPSYQTPLWWTMAELQVERVATFLALHVGGASNRWPLVIPPVPVEFQPQTATEVLLLTVNLPAKGTMSSLRRTFDAWWDFVVPPCGYSKLRWDEVKSDFRHLRVVPEVDHQPGIRWVAFDPSANHGKSPAMCQADPGTVPRLASAEVLMATALNPGWVASWDGDVSPYPNMAGLEAYWAGGWHYAPYLNRWDDEYRLRLAAHWGGRIRDRWACPTVRQVF